MASMLSLSLSVRFSALMYDNGLGGEGGWNNIPDMTVLPMMTGDGDDG